MDAATTDQQQQLEKPLLSGDSENDVEGGVTILHEEEVVRVAINPSILDRFFSKESYYFYDDIWIPYEKVLEESNHPLLPSQKEKLLLEGEGGDSESKVFGHLWIRFCARLAKAKAEFYQKEKSRFLLYGFVWLVISVLLVLQLTSTCDFSNGMTFAGFLSLTVNLLPLAVNSIYAFTVRVVDVTGEQAQGIVDDMNQLFFDEGFHVDLVSKSPIYVRFKKVSSPSSSARNGSGSGHSLKEEMSRYQYQAQRDHQETFIAQRQEKLKEHGPSKFIFGIRVETLLAWKQTINVCNYITGFVFVVSMVSLLSTGGNYYYLYY